MPTHPVAMLCLSGSLPKRCNALPERWVASSRYALPQRYYALPLHWHADQCLRRSKPWRWPAVLCPSGTPRRGAVPSQPHARPCRRCFTLNPAPAKLSVAVANLCHRRSVLGPSVAVDSHSAAVHNLRLTRRCNAMPLLCYANALLCRCGASRYSACALVHVA